MEYLHHSHVVAPMAQCSNVPPKESLWDNHSNTVKSFIFRKPCKTMTTFGVLNLGMGHFSQRDNSAHALTR